MSDFDPRTARGLSEAEAQRRLAAEGPNALPAERSTSLLGALLAVLREPMLLLLLAAAGIYLVLGDRLEAITLLVSVLFVASIALVQERKTQRALAALRDLASPRARVIRDGEPRRIAGRDVVRGDLVVIAEGDRVPADARVLESASLCADESLLTGESVPVRKRAATAGDVAAPPGGDDLPFVYSGTLVVKGRGVAEVIATGPRSELGRIGETLRSARPPRSPLELEVAHLVRVVAVAAIGLSLALAVIHGLRSHDLVGGLLAGVALAMSLLPEELPVVLAVFLAIGALRLSRRGVLTRRLPALETLGATTVLCTDKTGTLTENRMRIAALHAGGAVHEVAAAGPLPEAFHEVVEHGILASQRDPFDPMELAFHRLGAETLTGSEHLHDSWRLVKEYPLTPQLLSVAHAWRSPDGGSLVVSAKGAPEAIADLCHLGEPEARAISEAVVALARRGLRVLGVATARWDGGELPAEQHDHPFRFVGLVGLEDPLRPAVPAALAECRAAGVRVILITGDYAETATAIATRAGLARPDAVVNGPELAALDDAALARRLSEVDVIARAVPDHKLRIVRALQAGGAVVAMTGDGVNDAPALEAAHIGVAMGGRGTDVAREAADLVVTDDDFASIVSGVRLGRRIFDNLRKAALYVVAVHLPIIGLSLLPALFGWPLVLLPLHIVFLELIIDPACSIAFEVEPEEPDVMRRPPRAADARLIDRSLLASALAQGLSVLVAALAVLALARGNGMGEGATRALGFSALIGGNLALILFNLSASTARVRNPAAWAVIGLALAGLVAALWLAPVRGLFHFELPPPWTVLAAFGVGVASLAWVEVRTWVRRARASRAARGR